MTNEEEKILEEEEVTLEEAAEEAEELQEETQDEGHAIEIPVERREDANIEEILERQVLRDGGLRDAGHPEMIQTHLDNFLAKIAGETPIDDNPRNSTEFWLNEIAENLPGGGTTVVANPTLAGTEDALTGLQVGDTKYKVDAGGKMYMHFITLSSIFGMIVTNSATPFTTTTFAKWLHDHNFNGSPQVLRFSGRPHSADATSFLLAGMLFCSDGITLKCNTDKVIYSGGAFTITTVSETPSVQDDVIEIE